MDETKSQGCEEELRNQRVLPFSFACRFQHSIVATVALSSASFSLGATAAQP